MKRGHSNAESFNPYTARRASENVRPLNATDMLMRSAAAAAAAADGHKAKNAYDFSFGAPSAFSAMSLVPCCSCGKIAAPAGNSDFKCSFCEKSFCEDCRRQCNECGYVFCSNCACVIYEGRCEYPMCITCNSSHGRHRR